MRLQPGLRRIRKERPIVRHQAFQPRRIVRLIESHGHRQLWNAGGESLRERADAAMADERRATRKHIRERNERLMVGSRGEASEDAQCIDE